MSALPSKILDKLETLASQEQEPDVDRADPWGRLVDIVRLKYPTHGFPRVAFEETAGPLFSSLAEEIRKTQQQVQDHWLTEFLPRLRVFCVSEDRDNLLMWAHYAKDHTGLVFELRSLPEEDNPLSVAEPVLYCNSPPPFFTEAEWIDHILAIKKLNFQELSRRYAHSKSSHWQYEREWRVWDLRASGPEAFSDYPIRPNEVSSLYFGCIADPSFKEEAIALVRKAFPHVRFYQATKAGQAYELSYSEI